MPGRTSLGVLIVVIALLVVASLYFPEGAATSEKGQAQTAADAALAGAQAMVDDRLAGVSAPFSSLGSLMGALHVTGGVGSCSATGGGCAVLRR